MYKGLYTYLEEIDELKGKRFNFDYTASQPTNYSLNIPINNPNLTDDVMGNGKKQLVFYIVSVELWGEDILSNINNLDFFQKIKKKFEKNNKAGIFPDLGGNKIATKVIATTDGYIEATQTGVGRYQIQCKVEYIEKADRTNKAPLRF